MILVRFALENGVGQNLTAGVIVFALGVVWSRTKYWPLHALHARFKKLEASHEALHSKLDAHHRQHAAAIEALHQRVSADGRAASTTGPPATRSAPRTP